MDNPDVLKRVEELESRLQKIEQKGSRLCMVLFSGDFDKVMATFIIASGALAMGKEVAVFVTFWGLDVLKKQSISTEKKNILEKMVLWMRPKGPDRLPTSKMNFGGIGPRLFQYMMGKKNVEPLRSLIGMSMEMGLKVIACQMTMDVMGLQKEDLIDNVEVGGVATFLSSAYGSGVTLFV